MPLPRTSPVETRGKRGTLDQFQDERRRTASVLDTENRHDVRVMQRREHPGLALEPRAPVGVACKQRRQDLDRDIAPQARVARAKHLAHSAVAQRSHDLVGTDAGAGGE